MVYSEPYFLIKKIRSDENITSLGGLDQPDQPFG